MKILSKLLESNETILYENNFFFKWFVCFKFLLTNENLYFFKKNKYLALCRCADEDNSYCAPLNRIIRISDTCSFRGFDLS